MTSELLCANLIERYLDTCGLRFLRGDHDGEYFCAANTASGRLHVRLEICASFGDVVNISVTPARSIPVADRPRLTNFADTWNRQNRGVTAIVQGCPDPQRIGISARRSQWIRDGITFEEFASLVDRTIAAAIDLFAQVKPVVDVPSTTQPVLRNAG
ncbi:YbjN domain-containing protein [Mycobacterium sp. THU-M104]|uniref:YbjN domain-containing protein n=1 Tax=Mycobacterium sp. THU-M104 TaxID=3410515 RepID=UPI003B9C5426